MINAFTYMFYDNKFLQKAIFYFIFCLSTKLCLEFATVFSEQNIYITAMLLYIVGTIFSIVTNGYFISCVKALISQNKNYVLPVFNMKSLLMGIKYTISIFLAGLCLFFILFFVFILSLFLGKILSGLIIIIIALTFTAYFNALAFIFANTEAFNSFLQFKKATNLIKNNADEYVKGLIILIIVLVTIAGIDYIVSAIFKNAGMFATVLISAILSTYSIFITSFVIAKSIRHEYAKMLQDCVE